LCGSATQNLLLSQKDTAAKPLCTGNIASMVVVFPNGMAYYTRDPRAVRSKREGCAEVAAVRPSFSSRAQPSVEQTCCLIEEWARLAIILQQLRNIKHRLMHQSRSHQIERQDFAVQLV
jgi:hypothetical protein